MKILEEKIINGKKHYLIDDGFPKAQDGKPVLKNPYAVPIQNSVASSTEVNKVIPVEQFLTKEEGDKLALQKLFAEQQAIQKKSTVKKTKEQGKIAKAWDIASNPGTAIRELNTKGYISDNLGKGEPATIDMGINGFNPATYLNALGKTIKNVYNLDTYKNAGKAVTYLAQKAAGENPSSKTKEGALSTVGVIADGLTAIPAFSRLMPFESVILKNALFKPRNLQGTKLMNLLSESENTISTEGMKIMKELRSPEGFKRLGLQFAEADPSLDSKQINHLVRNRLDEVEFALKNNKPKVLKEQLNSGFNWGPSKINADFPNMNAHYVSRAMVPYEFRDIPKEYINGKSFSNFTDPRYNPGTITLGKNLQKNVKVLDHEIGHAIQTDGTMPIDAELKNLMSNKGIGNKIWNLYRNSSLQKYSDRDYFMNGSDGQESYAFLRELRRTMKERGLINNIYDEITPEALKKLRLETTFSKTPNFLEGTRLLKMTAPWKYGELSKIMNKAPMLAAPLLGIKAKE